MKKAGIALVVICAAAVAVDAAHLRHGRFEWEETFGFYAAYGFVACVLLVVIAKGMRKILMRDEDYYDR